MSVAICFHKMFQQIFTMTGLKIGSVHFSEYARKYSYYKQLNIYSNSVDMILKQTLFLTFFVFVLLFVLLMCLLMFFVFFALDHCGMFSGFYLKEFVYDTFSVFIFYGKATDFPAISVFLVKQSTNTLYIIHCSLIVSVVFLILFGFNNMVPRHRKRDLLNSISLLSETQSFFQKSNNSGS